MNNYLRLSNNAYIIFAYTILVLLFFIFNPQSLKFGYGDGGGRYGDRVDSYSEYIIRNTIKRNILNKEDDSFFPIVTKGYVNNDYNYDEDGYSKYTSNMSLQTVPATIIAKLLNINTEKCLDAYFIILRLIHALLFSLCLCSFLFYFCKAQGIKHHFIIPFLIGGSAGFTFYSQNLYFLSALIVMPASLIAFQLCTSNKFSKITILLCGMAYFLRGYEFATVFALLTAFSAATFTTGSWRNKSKSSAIAFSIICISFLLSVLTHITLVSADSNWSLSINDSVKMAFSTLQHRTASFDGVPLPLSAQFFHVMDGRWEDTAFSWIPGAIKIREAYVVIFILLIVILRRKMMSDTEKTIIVYGIIGYLSWYVFAYQHIMWHSMYDWYIFSLTLGLSFSMLIIIYVNNVMVKYSLRRTDKND